jgi:sugar-specific transcriptional regulator TrmB
MTDPRDEPRSAAVEHLEELGLSAYAARTFAALAEFEEATARDVSDAAQVPRTRVYDAVEELRGWGLVDVQQSTPKRFCAVSAETASRRFGREYGRRVDELATALDELETADRRSEQRGVWTVTGHEATTERVVEFLRSADREIVYMTVGELLDDPVLEALRTGADRGVEIRIAGMSDPVETTLADAVPAADTFESVWEWSDTPAGRMLMIDRRKTLVSVLTEDSAGAPEPRDETAIWGEGDANGLVVVLRAVFTWELGESP